MYKLHVILATLCLFIIALFCVYRGYDTIVLMATIAGIAGLSGYEINRNGKK